VSIKEMRELIKEIKMSEKRLVKGKCLDVIKSGER
jgi:hypothetical protein